MTAAVDGEACAVVATAADIICSLRGADLAGWTPPWRKHEPAACDGGQEKSGCGGGGGDDVDERDLAWPAVARGKRSRSSRRESPSASASAASADAKKEEKKKKKARRGARGSPASPMDYSGGSGSGSGASTSGGEDGAFCSQPEPPPAFPPAATAAVAAVCQQLAAPAAPAPPPPSKVRNVLVRACARAYLTSDIPVPVSCWFGFGRPRPLCCGRLVAFRFAFVRSCLARRTDGRTKLPPPCQQHEDDFPMTHRFSPSPLPHTLRFFVRGTFFPSFAIPFVEGGESVR